MLRLILFRHAKAVRAGSHIADFDRPLAPQGAADARQIGQSLVENGLLPDRILCSAALRTRQTLSCALPTSEDRAEFRRDLYQIGDSGYLGVIRAQGQDATTLMLVGHNPVIHDAAMQLVGSGDTRLITELAYGFPPRGCRDHRVQPAGLDPDRARHGHAAPIFLSRLKRRLTPPQKGAP